MAEGNNFRYVGALGYWADDENGLMLLGQRWYNPSIGRFLTVDPIKEGINWYAYVENNPLISIDPLGLEKCHRGKWKNLKWTKKAGEPKQCGEVSGAMAGEDTCKDCKGTKNCEKDGPREGTVTLKIPKTIVKGIAKVTVTCTYKGTYEREVCDCCN